MGFFRRKQEGNKPIKYHFKQVKYGKWIDEYITFCSIDDEETQKEEKIWISLQVLRSFFENPNNAHNFEEQLQEAKIKYLKEQVDD